jgi:pentatricopeptide repeat protein
MRRCADASADTVCLYMHYCFYKPVSHCVQALDCTSYAQQWQRVLDVFDSMRANGFKPPTFAFNRAIKVLHSILLCTSTHLVYTMLVMLLAGHAACILVRHKVALRVLLAYKRCCVS